MKVDNDVTPPSIRNHKYGQMLGQIWQHVRQGKGIATIVFCGKRGKGKSYSMMEWARILDVNHRDEPRFSPGDVRLDPVDFLRDLIGTYPIGKVICLDDAGLHLYKSDALTDILKKTSKILQNIRYKHPIIMMSLPYFEQLMKDARGMSDIYIEMTAIDGNKQLAVGAIQKLSISAYSGDLWRSNILQPHVHDTRFGVGVTHWTIRPYYFNKPPNDFLKQYESIKQPILNRINEQMVDSIEDQKNEEIGIGNKRYSFPKALEYCNQNIDKFLNAEGKVDYLSIMKDTFDDGEARFSINLSKMVAKDLNSQRQG